jgi:hypothetical protein
MVRALQLRFAGMSDFTSDVIGAQYWDGANPQKCFTGHSGARTRPRIDWW